MGPKVRSHVVVPLLKELTSKEVTLRRKALQALSRLGPPEKDTIPGLQKALKDPDREVRLAASRVLLKKK
jgi:HEAT repeat protein